MNSPSRRTVLGTAGASASGPPCGRRSRPTPLRAPARAPPSLRLPRAPRSIGCCPAMPDSSGWSLDRSATATGSGSPAPQGASRSGHHTGRAAHRRPLVPQVHLPGPPRLGRRPAGPAGAAARARAAPWSGPPRCPTASPSTTPTTATPPRTRDWPYWEHLIDVAGAARLQRGAGHRGHGGRLPPAAEGLRLLRRGGPRLAARPLPPAVVAAAEPVRVRRPALPRAASTDAAGLGRRIADRLRELGMHPVLPGYFGHRPRRLRRAQRRGAHVVPQGIWHGFERPDWLDPRTDAFAAVAASFYRHQQDLFGDGRPLQDGPAARGRHRR